MEHALLDLGASVNLIPFCVYQKLGLGELKRTSVTLQLADRSIREPRGIVEDVLVKIEQFYYHVDFIVLDYQHVLHPNVHTPIILSRPFLATANALINCRNGRMQLTFGSMTFHTPIILGRHFLATANALIYCRDRKSTRLNSSHYQRSRMPSSA